MSSDYILTKYNIKYECLDLHWYAHDTALGGCLQPTIEFRFTDNLARYYTFWLDAVPLLKV